MDLEGLHGAGLLRCPHKSAMSRGRVGSLSSGFSSSLSRAGHHSCCTLACSQNAGHRAGSISARQRWEPWRCGRSVQHLAFSALYPHCALQQGDQRATLCTQCPSVPSSQLPASQGGITLLPQLPGCPHQQLHGWRRGWFIQTCWSGLSPSHPTLRLTGQDQLGG